MRDLDKIIYTEELIVDPIICRLFPAPTNARFSTFKEAQIYIERYLSEFSNSIRQMGITIMSVEINEIHG